MASNTPDLPEGTDRILPGAGLSGGDEVPIVAERDDDLPEDISPADEGDTFEPRASAGAAAGADAGGSAIGGDWTTTRERLTNAGADLKGQATDKVRAFAVSGKDRAVESLDSFTRLIDDAATTVDEKVGEQYGAYVRQASDAIGSFATSLRDKDVDELFADARDAVKKSPGVAIGAAAALGFVLARIVKAGFDAASAPAAKEPGDGPSA